MTVVVNDTLYVHAIKTQYRYVNFFFHFYLCAFTVYSDGRAIAGFFHHAHGTTWRIYVLQCH